MAFLIGGANSAADTAYDVANSCMFDGSSHYLTTGSLGTATNAKKCTVSVWMKLSQTNLTGSSNYILGSYDDSRTNALDFTYAADNKLSFYHGSDDGNGKHVQSNKKFRDVTGWTHVVWACDTTQGTAANRIKIYFNGVEATKNTATYPDENAESLLFGDSYNKIGSNWTAATGTMHDGYMAEFIFIDGSQLAASSFGEFDEDSPSVWKPKDPTDLTFGNNGFWLDFEDSSALGNDVSGNNNDLSTSGLAAIDQKTDSPTNNFATLNPLDNYYTDATYSNGNLKIVTDSSDYSPALSTIGVNSGKWYCEIKMITDSGSDNEFLVGIVSTQTVSTQDEIGGIANGYGYYGNNGYQRTNNGSSSYGDAYTEGDIIGIALDLDNNKLYFAKNGTWQDSGDPTSGATGTGAISITAASSTSLGNYFFGASFWSSSTTGTMEANFGNPVSALSSAVADGNGYGSFEYAPPSGYYALCTKNLAEYG